MRVTLTIEADCLDEIYPLLTKQATDRITTPPQQEVVEKQPEEKEAEPVAKKPATKKAVAKKEEVKDEVTESSEKTEETKKEDPKPLTLEEVRAVVAALVKKDPSKRTDVKALLSEFGAASVTVLDPEKFNEFIEKLNNL